MFSKNNFHKHTFCIFTEVSETEIQCLKANYSSKSGSEYWFTADGVYRKSNHWGRAANCKWRLQSNFLNNSRTKIGYARWSDFHPINDHEKWYYITVDFKSKTVQYHHKNTTTQTDLYLRNASETTKRVKEIRALLSNNKKIQHWNFDGNFDETFEKALHYLANTDANLIEIKSQIMK